MSNKLLNDNCAFNNQIGRNFDYASSLHYLYHTIYVELESECDWATLLKTMSQSHYVQCVAWRKGATVLILGNTQTVVMHAQGDLHKAPRTTIWRQFSLYLISITAQLFCAEYSFYRQILVLRYVKHPIEQQLVFENIACCYQMCAKFEYWHE